MWYVILLIPPVLVIAITGFGFVVWRKADLRNPEFFSLPDKDLDKLSIDDVKPMVDQMTSRLAWFATAFVFYLSSSTSIIVSVIIILQMKSDNLGRFLIIALSLLIPFLFAGFWIKQSKGPAQPVGPLFLDKLKKVTSEKIVPPWLIRFFNVFAFFAISFIVGGLCSIIANVGQTPDDLSYQISSLQTLLFASAVFLVSCVLEINQLHRWSGAAVQQDVRPEIHKAAAVMAGAIGLFFSIILIATHLSVFVILQYRARSVNQIINLSLQKVFNVIVVLSPLLVGLISTFWSSSAEKALQSSREVRALSEREKAEITAALQNYARKQERLLQPRVAEREKAPKKVKEIDSALEAEFRIHADNWIRETAYLSDPVKKFMHRSHLRIIGMGEKALPLILKEAQKMSTDWLFALDAISPENPVKPEDEMNFEKSVKAWLEWGKERNLI